MGKREIPNSACKAVSARSKLVCAKRRAPATTESKNAVKVSYRIDGVGRAKRERQMLPHRLAIPDPPQKLEEHHQPAERSHRPLGLSQFRFPPAPKTGNFPVHCFVLLGVSSTQLKHTELGRNSAI